MKCLLPGALAFLLLPLTSLAQNPDSHRIDHWYFGDGAGLDFSQGAPQPDTNNAMIAFEGSSTMSDRDGNLLFYTNGKAVWDRMNDTMPNGSGLLVGGTPADGAIIIPKPGNDHIYYIFTTDGLEHNFTYGMRLHVVDMQAHNGLGDVVSKNQLLFAPSEESLAACRHANGCDYWVVGHERTTANYRAYRVTAEGVDTVPVISTTGLDHSAFTNSSMCSLCMRFSPQANKLVLSDRWLWQNTGISDDLQLSQFDRSTGEVSGTFKIPADTTQNGFCFSPNGEILYAESGYYGVSVIQYDVSILDSLTVLNSRQIIRHCSGAGCYTFGQGMRLGNDGRLYGCDEWAYVLHKDSVGVIEYPNIWGTGCLIRQWAVPIGKHVTMRKFNIDVADYSAPVAAPECWSSIITLEPDAPGSMRVEGNQLSWTQGTSGIFSYVSASVVSTDGREVLRSPIRGNHLLLSLASVPPGCYLFRLEGPSVFSCISFIR